MPVAAFEATTPEHLRGGIDRLAAELAEAAEATGSDRVPIAARADYLRARDAHRRALMAWAAASAEDHLAAVSDALEQCRAALGSARARLRG